MSSASVNDTTQPELFDHRFFKPPQGHLVPNMILSRHQVPNMKSPVHQLNNMISPRHPEHSPGHQVPNLMTHVQQVASPVHQVASPVLQVASPVHQVPEMISTGHLVPSPVHQVPNMVSPGHQVPRMPTPPVHQVPVMMPPPEYPAPNVFFPGNNQILRHQVPNVLPPSFPGSIQQQPRHPVGNAIIPGGFYPGMLPVSRYPHPGMLPVPYYHPGGMHSGLQGHQVNPAALQREELQEGGHQLPPAALHRVGPHLQSGDLQTGLGQHLNAAALQAGHQLMNMDGAQGQEHLQLSNALFQQVNDL